MAIRSISNFKAVKNSDFSDNTTGLITATKARSIFEDIADSFLNLTDGGTITGLIGAPFKFTNGAAERKLVLSENANNDHQVNAFGVTGITSQRYQIPDTTSSHIFYAGTSSTTSSELARLTGTGRLGIGIVPTAVLHLKAGTATANTAPLKLTTGTALTTPEDGAIEYHSSHLYFTIGSTRYQLDQQAAGLTIAAGTWTPTLTNILNTSARTAYECQYMRVGATVTFSGRLDMTVTAAATATTVQMSIPIASNFGAAEDGAGVGYAAENNQGALLYADSGSDSIYIHFISVGTGVHQFRFTASYQII